ncbi:MAG TPA: tetratricopeptide repeat protein [Vicinamibacterales bacterium]|nr:tetratricopeptide repeat protein [Vicinamibacterales bacterium]
MRGRQGADRTSGFAPIAERFRRGGDLERAVQLCKEGLAQFPDHLSGRVTLGWALLDLGRYDEARTELELVLRKAPDNLAAIRGLAELHDRAESTMLLDVEAPGPWPPEGAAIEEDTAAVDAPPELPAETLEAYEQAIAPSETFAAIAAAANASVEPAADAEASLEAAIADLDAQAEALVAARTTEADPPEPVVAAAATAHLIEEAPADPLAEFATAMSEPAAAIVEAAAIIPVEIETPAAASMAVANRAAEDAAAALEALEAEEALKTIAADAAPVVEALVAPEPVELSAAETAAAQHADRVADESIAAFAEAEAHAASHAASVHEHTAVAGTPIEMEPDPVRDVDVMRVDAAEPPPFATQGLDDFVQAREASVDLAEEVAAFAAAIEPADVEPQITRAIDVQYDHSTDDGPAIDLVPADAELAIAGAEKLAADLVAGVHADAIADDAAPEPHAADAFAAMQDLSSGGRLIEPLTHLVGHDAEDAPVELSSAFDHDVPNASAFESDVLASAAQAREAAASFETSDRDHAAQTMASAFADASAEDWTPPAVQEAPVPAPPPPSPVFAAIVESAPDFTPPEVTEVGGDASESLAARATVYDTAVPSVETPVTPIEPPKPKKGRTTASRRSPSPVASLEKLLRRVQARRQVVSESVA